MASDIVVRKINETWMTVNCDEIYMEMDIQDHFSFKVANAQFDPLVKAGKWDGVKKLYNRKTKRMHNGLLYQLMILIEQKEWTVDVDDGLLPDSDPLDEGDVSELVDVIKPHADGNPIEPYDYQIEAVRYMLNMDRSVCLSATSSGKSLMIYLAARIYQMMEELEGKTIFITVPSVSLVEQLYSDFEDYSTFEGSTWFVSQHCQKMSGKYPKEINSQIVITTWQTMAKIPYDEYERIGAIFIDEAHGAKASVLSKLIEQATHTPFKHGLTGTLDGTEANEMFIRGLLGPSKRIVSSREIIDKGRASDIHVNMVTLNHNQSDRKHLHDLRSNLRGSKKYQAEVDFLSEHQARNEFILGMIGELEGNTLVLFDRVEGYGNDLYEAYKEDNPEGTFLVTGDVDSQEREEIRGLVDHYDNAKVFASYGTMSTGISIKKLHNLVLISSSKSPIRVLQSLGRLMRLHSSKSRAEIYDIVDDLSEGKSHNYTYKHAAERLQYYQSEQFDVDFMEISL